ncbi:unnamed protein product [Musa textilis]
MFFLHSDVGFSLLQVFFARLILADMNMELKGLRCIISGAGKIAMHVLEKLFSCGAIPITISADSKGYSLDEDGFDYVKLSFLRDIKVQQKSLRDYLKSNPRAKYFEGAKPWSEQCDIAFPCASQNEIDQPDAVALINSGCRILIEGSSMPCTLQAFDVLRKANILVASAKAASAGGVAVGELELGHECNLMQWSAEDFEAKLQEMMKQIHEKSLKAASEYGCMKDSPESRMRVNHGSRVKQPLLLYREYMALKMQPHVYIACKQHGSGFHP